jgi:hypothetical protein
MAKTKHKEYFLAGLVSVLTFLLYIKALQNDFVGWDDNFYVTANPYIRTLNLDLLQWAFLKFYSYNWHPLTWLSHALDYAFWGLNPFGHHLTNNIIHGVNTFLVVVLVMKLFSAWKDNTSKYLELTFFKEYGGVTIGVCTGLLFGLHPLHVESVAWIAERKDLLCALFFLLSVVFYSNYIEIIKMKSIDHDSSSRRLLFRKYLLSLGCFILALLSKPMAVTLPIVLLILDYYPFNRINSFKVLRSLFVEKLPFFLFSIGSSILTYLAQKSGNAVWEGVSFPARMLVATKSIVAYIWNMLLPLNLMPFYPYPREGSFLSLEYIGTLFLVIGVTLYCVYISKRQKLWLTAWACYVVTLLPVLGIIQVGGQFMADRYTYLPSIGPFVIISLLIAWLFHKLISLQRNKIIVIILASVIGLLISVPISYLTYMQIGIWKNGIDLWTYVIKKEPGKILFAYYNRGGAFAKEGKYYEAIDDYSKVITWNYQEYSKVYVDRGLVYLRIGKTESAIADFRKACGLGNDFGCKALRIYLKNGS